MIPWWLWTLALGLFLMVQSGHRPLEMRWRVLVFVVVCVALGVLGPPDPWPLILAATTYMLVVFPVIWKDDRG